MMPDIVLKALKESGWYQGRKVALPADLVSDCSSDHPALAMLANFGGLYIGKADRGLECATSDVLFGWLGHDFDDETAMWETLLSTKLVGVGEVHNAHGALFVALDGRCFELSLVHDAFAFVGSDIGEALRLFLNGLRSRPMLRPDQESVAWNGKEYSRRSPELYTQ